MLVRDTLANLLENGFDTVERLRCIEASTSAGPRAHRDRGHPQRAWATRPSRECDGRCVPPLGLGHQVLATASLVRHMGEEALFALLAMAKPRLPRPRSAAR